MSKWDFKISIKEDGEFLQDGFNRIVEDAVKHDEPMTYEELERSMLEEFHKLKEASIKDLVKLPRSANFVANSSAFIPPVLILPLFLAAFAR